MSVLIQKVKLKVSMLICKTSFRRIQDVVIFFLFLKLASGNDVQQTKST
jgi:hypothetical protein